MKSEKLFIILSAYSIGILLSISDLLFFKLYQHLNIPDLKPIYPSFISILSLTFFAFSIYFSLKYSGIIKFMGSKKCQ